MHLLKWLRPCAHWTFLLWLLGLPGGFFFSASASEYTVHMVRMKSCIAVAILKWKSLAIAHSAVILFFFFIDVLVYNKPSQDPDAGSKGCYKTLTFIVVCFLHTVLVGGKATGMTSSSCCYSFIIQPQAGVGPSTACMVTLQCSLQRGPGTGCANWQGS